MKKNDNAIFRDMIIGCQSVPTLSAFHHPNEMKLKSILKNIGRSKKKKYEYRRLNCRSQRKEEATW